MILKRLAISIKKQDWFVVCIEIMIVVVGIFIGLQVDDWNEERNIRLKEVVFLSTLHNELLVDMEKKQTELANIEDRMTVLGDILDLLLNSNDAPTLTKGQCSAIRVSHIFYFNEFHFGALDSISNFDPLIISSPQLLREITRFLKISDSHKRKIDFLQRKTIVLHSEFPLMFESVFTKNGLKIMGDVKCKIENMTQNEAFKAALLDNSGRWTGLQWLIKVEIEALDAMHKIVHALDKIIPDREQDQSS